MTYRTLSVVIALLLVAACTESASQTNNGNGPDAGPDAQTDANGPDTTENSCPSDVDAADGTAITEYGPVVGQQEDGVWNWLGIPYASPPTGDLRLRPPEEPACFEADGFQADAYSPTCPQKDQRTGEVSGDEDCLTLNIWSSDTSQSSPVMVFIHGGGNVQGSSSEAVFGGAKIYDGRRLAENGDVVVVTINYRLGPLGFLAHPDLAAESDDDSTGNYGLMDQQAALGWVQRNIEAFGGDPDQVMIFGESAGAVNSCAHIASPLSAGLFDSALMQSGGCTAVTRATAQADVNALLEGSACEDADDVAACLRDQSVEDIFDIFPPLVSAAGVTGDRGMDFGPVVDDHVLEQVPALAIQAGNHNAVPAVFGTNADEAANLLGGFTVNTEEQYEQAVQTYYGSAGSDFVDDVLAAYPADDYDTPQDALIQVVTDQRFTCPNRIYARSMARAQSEPVYRYFFTRNAQLRSGEAPARHAIELLYVFGTLRDIPGFTPVEDDVTLSERMVDYWTYFARNGSFEAVEERGELIAWPEYTVGGDEVLVLDAPLDTQVGVRNDKCDVWDELYGF
jgi:para-nitrobenzyl esterase